VQSRRTKQSQEAPKRRPMLRCDATNGESTESRVAVTLAEDVWSGLSHAGWAAALVGLRPGVTAQDQGPRTRTPAFGPRNSCCSRLHCQTTAANRQHRRASPGSSRLFLTLWLATLHPARPIPSTYPDINRPLITTHNIPHHPPPCRSSCSSRCAMPSRARLYLCPPPAHSLPADSSRA
jgi:hypothetical protein